MLTTNGVETGTKEIEKSCAVPPEQVHTLAYLHMLAKLETAPQARAHERHGGCRGRSWSSYR
jgi:hypothetical protein